MMSATKSWLSMPFPLKEARFDCRVCPSIPWTPATCKANRPKREDNSRAIQQATETRSTKTRILSFLSWLGLSYLSSEMSLSRSCRRSVSKHFKFSRARRPGQILDVRILNLQTLKCLYRIWLHQCQLERLHESNGHHQVGLHCFILHHGKLTLKLSHHHFWQSIAHPLSQHLPMLVEQIKIETIWIQTIAQGNIIYA